MNTFTLAQELLQRDYPNIQGFQSTLFSQINGFTSVDSDCESLQFHHINGDHWVAIIHYYWWRSGDSGQ